MNFMARPGRAWSGAAKLGEAGQRAAKQGNWQQLYGARRRAIDRKLLAECERQLPDVIEFEPPRRNDEEAREAIARAFGRPVQ